MTYRNFFLAMVSVAALLTVGNQRADAATLSCRSDTKADLQSGIYDADDALRLGLPADRKFCEYLLFWGEIQEEDVSAFSEWMKREPFTRRIKIASPGGSISAAMQIGRIIRARFLTVSTFTLSSERHSKCSREKIVQKLRRESVWKEDKVEADLAADQRRTTRKKIIAYLSTAFSLAISLASVG